MMRAGPSWSVFAAATQASIEYSCEPMPLAIWLKSFMLSVCAAIARPSTISMPPPESQLTCPSSSRFIGGITPETSNAVVPCSSLKFQSAIASLSLRWFSVTAALEKSFEKLAMMPACCWPPVPVPPPPALPGSKPKSVAQSVMAVIMSIASLGHELQQLCCSGSSLRTSREVAGSAKFAFWLSTTAR